MALTKDARIENVVPPPDRATRRWLDGWVVLLLAIAVLLVAFGWTFLRDPSVSAPTRDPAWYTWRANLLLHDSPGLIAKEWGPFSMFSGGYRISVPLFGAMLVRIAGIDLYTFSAFMMVGVPILTGLALGAFAYRVHRDRLLFLLVLLATAALFMTTPYVGYLDNITILYVLSAILAFIPPSRTSWGARSAMFLLGVVAAYTHPTTCVIFGASLMVLFALHLVTSRFRLAEALKTDGHYLLSIGSGMILGLATWLVGPWGVKGSLADAALPPPYTQAVFENRLWGWVGSLQPLITVPLILIGIGWVVLRARRDRKPASQFGSVSAVWLIPLLGTLGWIAGKAYPYYRFMNATAALFPLVGLGAWVLVRWFLGRGGAARAAGIVAALLVVGSLGYVWASGRDAAQWSDPDNQWIDQGTRTALAAAAAVAERERDRPIVFVVNFGDTYQAYGWAKTFTNVSRTGLPGDAVKRSATYFGDVDDLLADRRTQLSDPTYNKMARGFFRELQVTEAEYPQPPVVFLVRQFNGNTANATLLDRDPAPSNLVPIGRDIAVVTGSGLATPSPRAVDAAKRAEGATAALYADHPGPLGNLGHTARVLFGLALLLVLPGLVASRWFDLERDPWIRVALVPALSFALVVVAGVLVIAVTRSPLSAAHAWMVLALALAIAAGLALGRASVLRTLWAFGGFFDSLFSVFSNRDFSVLMGVQFLAQAGQGIVQGAIGKSIAFGGEKGFDVSTVPSADYLLKVVLALYVPYTLFSPFIGVFIDRFHRRKVVAWTNVLTAAIVVVVAGAAMLPLGGRTSEGNVGATIALVVGLLAAQACVRVALAVKSAAIPDVLSGRDLLQGNGLSQAGGALFQVVGIGFALGAAAALPAWLVVAGGAGVILVAAIVAKQLRRVEARPREASFAAEAARVLHTIRAGLREIASRPAAALGLSSFQMLRYQFWGFGLFTFALYAKYLVQGGDASGVALGLSGGGGLLGGAIGLILAQRWKDRVPPISLLLASMILLGAGSVVFGALVSIAGFAAMLFVGFFAFFLGKISADTIVQEAMPDDFRGRAFALFDIAYNLGFIVPALILSFVWIEGDAARTRTILIASGAVFLALTALIAAWSRRIERFTSDEGERVAVR
jgi:hypothetical protein